MDKANGENNSKQVTRESIWSKTGRFLAESSISVGKYIVGKLITSLVIGLLAFIVFKIIGINLAWLYALILGLTNIVPVFGPWVGVILCALIVVWFEPIFALYTTLTGLILQILEQFVLLPIIVGKAVDLKPMLIICVLILGSLAFGFWGVLLAIPIAAVVKIWFNIFISKEKDNKEGE
jgi:predicted PurR-regulated permease PerM